MLIWIFWIYFIGKASIHLVRFQIQLSMLIFKENYLMWLGWQRQRTGAIWYLGKLPTTVILIGFWGGSYTSSQQLWREKSIISLHFILSTPPHWGIFFLNSFMAIESLLWSSPNAIVLLSKLMPVNSSCLVSPLSFYRW